MGVAGQNVFPGDVGGILGAFLSDLVRENVVQKVWWVIEALTVVS